MRAEFVGCDGSVVRWYPKVARAASASLRELLAGVGSDSDLRLFAAFDRAASGRVVVERVEQGASLHWIVRFSAGTWESLESSVSDATAQLASAVARLAAGARLRKQLAAALETAGIALVPVTLTSVQLPTDSREQVEVVVPTEALDVAGFFSLCDQLDSVLEEAGVGEVIGSGVGVGGWSLEVAASDRERAVELVKSALRSRAIVGATIANLS